MIQPALAKRAVEAARRFAQWEPWEEYSDEMPIALRLPDQTHPAYAVILGNAGVEFGLAIYLGERSIEQLRLLASDERPPVVAPMLLLSFDPPGQVPEMLREISRLGGASERVIPVFAAIEPGRAGRLPRAAELKLVIQVLAALRLAGERDLLRPRPFDAQRGGRLLCLTVTGDRPKVADVVAGFVDVAATPDAPPARAGLPGELWDLPVSPGQHWLVGLEPAPMAIGEEARVPDLLAVVDAADGGLVGLQPALYEDPGDLADRQRTAVELFADIAARPKLGEPRLPERLTVLHAALGEALAPGLAARGVQVDTQAAHPLVAAVFAGFRESVMGDPGDGTEPTADWPEQQDRLIRRLAEELRRVDFRSRRALAAFFGSAEVGLQLDALGIEMHDHAFCHWYFTNFRARPGLRTIAERLLLRDDLPEPERRLLQAQIAGRVGLYQVARLQPPVVGLSDVLADFTVDIVDGQLARSSRPGQVLPARLVQVDEHRFLLPIGPRLPLGDFERALAWLEDRSGAVTADAVQKRPERLGSLWEWFLDEHQAARPRRLTNTDGDHLEMTVATFRVDDWSAVTAAFGARDDIDQDGDEWLWYRGGADDDDERTLLGRFERVANELLLHTNSAQRWASAREWLDAIPGLGFAGVRPVAFDKPDGSAGRRPPPEELPAEARSQVQAIVDRQCLKWLDEQIPALGGRTPRQAVASAEGREQVLRLIRSWPDPGGIPGLTVPRARLRAELGLPAGPPDEAAAGAAE